MKIITIASILCFVLPGVGCGPRTVYDSLRFYEEAECQKLQGSDRDECSKRVGMSYDEYQRQLKQREQKR